MEQSCDPAPAHKLVMKRAGIGIAVVRFKGSCICGWTFNNGESVPASGPVHRAFTAHLDDVFGFAGDPGGPCGATELH